MPVFLFGLAVSGSEDLFKIITVFISLHLFLYPASNGFNSYFDKDEGSIGGLKNPPKVDKNLYWTALAFDGVALLMGFLISWQFSVMLMIYGLVSKAYSHPSIRLKNQPILGWLAVGLFQGYFTFLMTVFAVSNIELSGLMDFDIQIPALLSSALLLGSYPMTQIYQHEEDKKRGDITISLRLGIRGTFFFTGIFFFLSNIGFLYYFMDSFSLTEAIIFQLALGPVMGYFFYWFWISRNNVEKVNFQNTMRLNFISSFMLNGFFIYLTFS